LSSSTSVVGGVVVVVGGGVVVVVGGGVVVVVVGVAITSSDVTLVMMSSTMPSPPVLLNTISVDVVSMTLLFRLLRDPAAVVVIGLLGCTISNTSSFGANTYNHSSS
jgi:hypothetical protein